MEVLKVENISKKLSNKLIIDDMSFAINEKEIVGFIGPNGSGKTTTLRMVTNLIYPDQGLITICGNNIITHRKKALKNMAAIVEYPALYPFLSGIEHLKFIAKSRNKTKTDIDRVVSTIGLERDIKKKTGKYSLGMKQRLGIGLCLLSEPKLLILDEPTNGLDPTAILELRQLLQQLNQEKDMTIFFSSHNLTEIAKLCHRMIFIKEGKIIDIREAEQLSLHNYLVTIDEPTKMIEFLKKNNINYYMEDHTFTINASEEYPINKILRLLIEKDIDILDITKVEADVESMYKGVYNSESSD